MREIKVKAWYEQSQTWVYFTIGQQMTDVAKAIYSNICINGGIWYQFTGLKDKNGNEIYEGDYLMIKGATCNENDFEGEVIFTNGTYCLKAKNQPENGKYIEVVRFWKDGCHDHHSLEMIESFEMEVIKKELTNPTNNQ